MSVVARVLRQFHEGPEVFTLEKTLVLPEVPTMGTRLDLRSEDVKDVLTVVGVTSRPLLDGPGVRLPCVDILLIAEPVASAELPRSACWRDTAPPEPEKV